MLLKKGLGQSAMAELQIKGASNSTPKRFPLTGDSILVGRQAYCDLVLENHAVSREHAKFIRKKDQWFVEDLQSRNGVWINGKRTGYEPVEVKDGDQIAVGDVTMVFHAYPENSSPKKESSANWSQTLINSANDEELDPGLIRSQYSVGVDSSFLDHRSKPRYDTVEQYENEIQLLEERVRVLLDFARILGKAEDSGDLTPRFLQCLLRLFPKADSACVFASAEEEISNNIRQWNIVGHASRVDDDKEEFRVSRAVLRYVVETRVAVLSDSVPDDSRFDASQSVLISRIHSVMAAPIYEPINDRILGVIQIDAREHNKGFTQEDLRLLVVVAGQIAVYWENQRYRDAVVKEKIAVREMQLANQVQRGFLPLEPPQLDAYEFFDYYRPAKFVGGDYFDYISLPDESIAIILGDVSGKGISASLLMAKLSSEARYSLVLEKSRSAAMARLNRVFSENHWGDRFITLVMVILETRTGVVRIFNAGHLYPIVAKSDGTVERVGEGFNSFPLGISLEAEFPEFVYPLQQGDSMILMSDGMTDAMNSDQETYGESRVLSVLRNPTGDNAVTLGKRLVDDLKKFSGACQQTDDQCLVVFRRTPTK